MTLVALELAPHVSIVGTLQLLEKRTRAVIPFKTNRVSTALRE
jgi:hypothetical protein